MGSWKQVWNRFCFIMEAKIKAKYKKLKAFIKKILQPEKVTIPLEKITLDDVGTLVVKKAPTGNIYFTKSSCVHNKSTWSIPLPDYFKPIKHQNGHMSTRAIQVPTRDGEK